MCAWLSPCTNSLRKILTLQVQRFNPINVRNGDGAIAIGDGRVSMHICPFVVNLDHLSWIRVVVDHHSCVAYNGHTTNFTGMQPTDMDMGGHPVGKSKIEVGNIVDMRLKMSMRLYLNLLWPPAKQIEQD